MSQSLGNIYHNLFLIRKTRPGCHINKGLKEVTMLLPRKPVIWVSQRQSHWGISHCLYTHSVDPRTTTGREQWQEMREEARAVRRNGHYECQTSRFEERIRHAGNIDCRVNLSQQNCCCYRKAISCYSGDSSQCLCTSFFLFYLLWSLTKPPQNLFPTGKHFCLLRKPARRYNQEKEIQLPLMFQTA